MQKKSESTTSKQSCDSLCALCETSITKHPITDNDKSFCCPGCHAVFQILLTKNQLASYRETSLFQDAVKAGVISNPTLLEELRKLPEDNTKKDIQKIYLEIQDMWCPSCSEIIRYFLLKEKGIYHCVIDYATDMAFIEFSPCEISRIDVERIISRLGYNPQPLQGSETKAISPSLNFRMIIAAFFALNLMMFAYPIYANYFDADGNEYALLFAWISLFASLPVFGYSGWPIFRRFYTSLRTGIFGMETLVVIGVTSAFGLSLYELLNGRSLVYFDSMAVIIFFVLLGKVIESKAKFSAKEAILRLTQAIPRRGRKVLSDGGFAFVSIKEIIKGDKIVVFTGERVVLDGIVCDGEGTCDESLMTGESWPVSKEFGSDVLAGTILQHGRLIVEVTANAEETALHKIINMVEQEIGHKSSYVRIADVIVKWFVPAVVSIALITGLICLFFEISDPGYSSLQTAVLRAVSILLISCPCAIGIAAPLAESSLINALADLGVIVRNRAALYWLGNETCFVFDKTGTITEGKLNLIKGLDNLTTIQLKILKGLTSCSTHPISQAIHSTLCGDNEELSDVEEFPGKGMSGYYKGVRYLLGSAAFIKQTGCFEPKMEEGFEGVITEVYFVEQDHCIATLYLRDVIKEGAEKFVKGLFPTKTLLLSGDGTQAVRYVAKECGFHEWEAQAQPLRKREVINDLRNKGEIVLMMGDGINDAPALTAAHVGLAVVSASDISIQVSDLLLTSNRFDMIPTIRQLSRKGRRIIYQNLFWAFFYNIMGIGLAVFGALTPLFAAFAMVASSMIVVGNSKRI